MIKVFMKNVKAQGLTATLKKTAAFVLKKMKMNARKFPVLYYYWKIKILMVFLPRSKNRTMRVLKFTVHYNDLRSLFMEFKDIFKNQIYYFHCENDSPVIIDGGGFIGISVLYFKWLYPNAKILVYEPNTRALEFLEKNISENKLDRIEIHKAGLSSNSGTVAFSDDGTDGGKISERGSTSIRIEKLSGTIKGPVDYVKLNIEGSELDVLKDLDAEQKFSYIRELCFEWHSFSQSAQNLDECLRILKKNGYKYLINHFDYVTNRAVRPPFHLEDATQYYLIIYAKKTDTMAQK